MKENKLYFRRIIFHFRKNNEIIRAVYGEDAFDYRMRSKWFSKFCSGDSPVNDDHMTVNNHEIT